MKKLLEYISLINQCRRSIPYQLFLSLCVALFLCSFASASLLPFEVDLSSQYLVVGNHINGSAINTNNYELGANTNPVPSPVDPTLVGNVPDLPDNAVTVFVGIGRNGNLAVTDDGGTLSLSNVNVYADENIGIRVAGPKNSNTNQSSNSYFNKDIVDGTDRKIDLNHDRGVTYNYNHATLMTELNTAFNQINLLGTTDTIVTGGLDVKADNKTWLTNNNTNLSYDDGTFVYTASTGLNVVSIDTDDSDFKLDNINFVIQGGADASVIFLLEDNMLVTQANILIGDGGIGAHDVLFYNGENNNDTQFGFSKTILSGVAYWSQYGNISIDNAQGCTQLVGQTVDLNDVRLGNCGFVPEPSTLALLGLGGLLLRRRKYKHNTSWRRCEESMKEGPLRTNCLFIL